MMCVDRRRGFTLLEVIIALSLGAIVVVGARLVVSTLADSGQRIDTASRAIDRESNGRRLLAKLVADVQVGPEPGATFGGSDRFASFRSWCDSGGGWKEHCHVDLAIESTAAGAGLVVRALGERLEMLHIEGGARLLYLQTADNGGSWFEAWATGTTVPLALGVVTPSDTLVFPIGIGR